VSRDVRQGPDGFLSLLTAEEDGAVVKNPIGENVRVSRRFGFSIRTRTYSPLLVNSLPEGYSLGCKNGCQSSITLLAKNISFRRAGCSSEVMTTRIK
jgi:hypothetical protein